MNAHARELAPADVATMRRYLARRAARGDVAARVEWFAAGVRHGGGYAHAARRMARIRIAVARYTQRG